MNKIKKGLGRGLSSLIGETKTVEATNKLPISDLYPNKFQPRKIFDEDSLNDLKKSINERGIIQPIIVRKSDENSKYEIIAGERRWLAAQKAGLHEVPVVVTKADDLKSLEFAIVENVQSRRNQWMPPIFLERLVRCCYLGKSKLLTALQRLAPIPRCLDCLRILLKILQSLKFTESVNTIRMGHFLRGTG